MLDWLIKLFSPAPTRFDKVMKNCGCACKCPECWDILNDQARAADMDDGNVQYVCSCGRTSLWDFDMPVPIRLA